MLCLAGLRLPLSLWLGLPLLCVGAMLGLGGLGLLAVDSPTEVFSWMFAAAGALAYLLSAGVSWPRKQKLSWLRWVYPIALVLTGFGLDGLKIPSLFAMLIGIPCGIWLIVLLRRQVLHEADSEPETPVELATTKC